MDSGREWLFVGDTVWSDDHIARVTPPPRLVSWVGREDVDAQVGWLRTLVELRTDHPEIGILVAHDAATWKRVLDEGAFEPL